MLEMLQKFEEYHSSETILYSYPHFDMLANCGQSTAVANY